MHIQQINGLNIGLVSPRSKLEEEGEHEGSDGASIYVDENRDTMNESGYD